MTEYHVWKNGVYNGENTDWEQLSGKEFFALVSSPESKGRYFVFMDNNGDKELNEYYLEATREKYLEWKRENMAKIRKLQEKYKNPIEFISFDTVLYEDDDGNPVTLADVIPDPESDRMLENLRVALLCLTKEERELIDLLFLKNKTHLRECQIADVLGMYPMELSRRKKKIFQKLRELMLEN